MQIWKDKKKKKLRSVKDFIAASINTQGDALEAGITIEVGGDGTEGSQISSLPQEASSSSGPPWPCRTTTGSRSQFLAQCDFLIRKVEMRYSGNSR